MFQLSQRGYSYFRAIFLWFSRWLALVLDGKKVKGNIDALDGVRAIACICVAALHISLITTNDISLWSLQSVPLLISTIAFSGDTGVTLFFILSGFLLFLPYTKSLLSDDVARPSTWQFYLRRALRILPVYYISLILIVIIFHPAYLHWDHLRQWIFFLTMFMDSSTTTYKQINGPFWTLAVEWQFYLLLPWLALGMSWVVRRGSLKRRFLILTICLGLLATWGVLTRFLGLYLASYPDRSFIFPRSVMDYIIPFIYGPASSNGVHGKFLEDFAVGMFISSLYTLAHSLPREHPFLPIAQKVAPWFLALGFTLLLTMAMWKYNVTIQPHAWSFFDPFGSGIYNVVGEFCYALSYGFFVTAVLFGKEWLRRPFAWTPLRWIGVVSFGIYMWHLPLLESLTKIVVVLPLAYRMFYYGIYWLGFFVIIAPFSFVLFLLIEKPCMRLGSLFRPAYERKKPSSKIESLPYVD